MNAPLDLDALRAAWSRGETPHLRHFWGHRPGRGGALTDSVFSQWWPCRFEVAGQGYASAEQFMMAGKARLFGDAPALERILATDDPKEAKALGRQVRGFVEAPWAAVRFDLVTAGNLAKFDQDPGLRAHLLGTGEDVLVEASPVDAVWGIGLAARDAEAADPRTWRGLNLLGFALVRVRSVLRGDLTPPDAGRLPL